MDPLPSPSVPVTYPLRPSHKTATSLSDHYVHLRYTRGETMADGSANGRAEEAIEWDGLTRRVTGVSVAGSAAIFPLTIRAGLTSVAGSPG